jgi:regulator of CtrA degradation
MSRRGPTGGTSMAFLGGPYGALTLLVEARDYVASLGPADRTGLAPAEQLRLCCETLRLTARLTGIMAWLLGQRAVQAGEISRAQALGGRDALARIGICMEGAEAYGDGLPERMVSLLDRSHRLYLRIARLDELARRAMR